MSKVNLKEKSVEDLNKDLAELREELRKSRFNIAGATGLRTDRSMTRKKIARIMTELKSR